MEKEILENLINQNISANKIAKRFGVSLNNTLYWINKHGLKTNHISFKDKEHSLIHLTEKKCPICDITKPVTEFHNKSRKSSIGTSPYCKECSNAHSTAKQKNLKQLCVDYKGGSCVLCGYNKCLSALEFHHLDPTQKEFSLGKINNRIFSNIIKEELDKCILLCSNCHKEEHERIYESKRNIIIFKNSDGRWKSIPKETY